MNWQLWSRQIDAIVRLELKKYVLGRRWLAIYVLAFGPNFLLLIRALLISGARNASPQILIDVYAHFFQLFMLRFAIFFGCAVIFSQLFRGEVLEKTLHYYFLAPVRREVVVFGKYLAALVATIGLFTICTITSFVLLFGPARNGMDFVFSDGVSHLAKYLAIAMLGCMGYGALFLLVGLVFKNPISPILFALGWESFNFVLPPVLQKISVVHYLLALMPVSVPRGPLAVIATPPPVLLAIPGLLIVTAAILAFAAVQARRAEITYSAD